MENGRKLKNIYLKGKFDSSYKTYRSLMKLLVYQVYHLEEDQEREEDVIDFCVSELEKIDGIDPQKENRIFQKILSKLQKRKQRQKHIKQALKGVCAACLILSCTMTTQAVSLAMGKDFFQFVVDNTNKILHISPVEEYIPEMEPDLDELKWLPKGYQLVNKSGSMSREKKKSYFYKKQEKNIRFSVNIPDESKEDSHLMMDTVEEYKIGETLFHIVRNKSDYNIVWNKDSVIYFLGGKGVSREELLQIVDENFGGYQ